MNNQDIACDHDDHSLVDISTEFDKPATVRMLQCVNCDKIFKNDMEYNTLTEVNNE